MIRPIAVLVVGVSVCWWLFGDTYARHRHAFRDHQTLRFSHFGTYQDYNLWKQIIAEFERRNPDVHVRQEYIVGLSGAYNTKMRQQILSSTLPDVALIQLGQFHELAEHFADLTGLLPDPSAEDSPNASVLDPTGLSTFQYKGKQRGLPVSGGNLAIFCNRNCFERAAVFRGKPVPLPEPDWTIDEFRRTAELLTCDFDGDGRIDQFGFWLPRWIYYLPWIWSMGARLTDDTLTNWEFTGPEAEAAIRFYRDLAVGQRVCPRDEEVPQLFQDVGFLNGKVGMCVNGPWFIPFLSRTNLSDKYVVVPVPRGSGGRVTRITWDGIVMPAQIPPGRRTTASKFIKFLLSRSVQDAIATSGRALPARRDSTAAFVGSPGDPRRRTFVEALSYSRLQPLLPQFSQLDRVINTHLRQLLEPGRVGTAHRLTVSEALDRLASDPVVLQAFDTLREGVSP